MRNSAGWRVRLAVAALAAGLALVITAFFIAPFVSVIALAVPAGFPGYGVVRTLCFTTVQAFASSGISVLVGMPGAFFVARRIFPGRGLLLASSAVPLCVPPVVMALGFVMFFGREGFANAASEAILGVGIFQFLYTAPGIVIVHTAYNFPLVVLIVGDAWAELPGIQEDGARTLGASPARIFFQVTLRQLAPAVGAAASLVFLYSFFSFVIAMLVGGLSGSTMEVELFRAARTDLDSGKAGVIVIMETAVSLLVVGAYAMLESRASSSQISARSRGRTRKRLSLSELPAALAYFALVVFFLFGPLGSIILRSFVERNGYSPSTAFGFGNYIRIALSPSFLHSLGLTLAAAGTAALFAVIVGAVFLASSRNARIKPFAATLSFLPLAVSGTALALGWTRISAGTDSIFFPPFLIIAAVIASSSFPLVFRPAAAALGNVPPSVFDAARSIGADAVDTATRITMPLVSRALLSGAAMVFAIGVGDANAALMLGSGAETLSLRLYRYIGGYRFGEACALGTILFLASVAVFSLSGGRRDAL
ncbi:MAG: iron ABC transporter permease [Spirochaetes bacterium]|nr:iron ABC transporter permease [Spirochaetota bacterium]